MANDTRNNSSVNSLCDKINKPPVENLMFDNSDFEDFAKFLGLEGTDVDLFYEQVYDKVMSDEDYELMMEQYQ